MSNVTFPAREKVNGLSIVGWLLHDTGRDELFPAHYCGNACALQGGYDGHDYEAFPLYAIDAEDDEVCDICFAPLTN